MSFATQALESMPMTDRRLGLVHFDDIVAARHVLQRELTPTPLITHPLLTARLACPAFVKLENAMPLGSFNCKAPRLE